MDRPSSSASHTPQWNRYIWTAFALLYCLLCIGAGWYASRESPKGVQMAFAIFGFLFFVFGYLSYFYVIANFSHAERIHERRRMAPSPPPKARLIAALFLGIFWSGGLFWLLFTRM